MLCRREISRATVVLLACLGLVGVVLADEFVTVDFPMDGRRVVASGLAAPPRQVATPDGVGYAEILLRPARKDDRVFLTLIFEEDGARGPAIFWASDVSERRVMLSENLAEGVVGLNRRTILLPPEVAVEPGRLYLLGRQDRLRRLRIDWSRPEKFAVAADQERPAFMLGGARLLDRDVTGQATMTPPDAWFGSVLDAALQDGVADLAAPTELVASLKGAAGAVRLRARFLGLPLGRGVRVWVNGRLAGRLVPVVPSLTDPGYIRQGRRTVYAGWREGSLYLEPGTLTDGDNSILIEAAGASVYLAGAALEIESPETAEIPVPEESPTPAPRDATVAPLYLGAQPEVTPSLAPSPEPTPAAPEAAGEGSPAADSPLADPAADLPQT